MDRVELIIQLTGDKEALSSLRSVKAAVDQLKNTKIQLRIDRLDIEREISRVKRQIDDLTLKKREVKLDGGDVKAVERDIINAKKELAELTERKRSIELEMRGADIAAQQARELEKELSNAENAAQRLGGALQSIGGAMQSVGSMFKSISGMFDSNIVDTLERYATVMTARMFTQNWGKAFERYDILSTYADYLSMVGVSADEASASLDKINAKIQGIPVGLSDVAYQTRMYQMYLDDMERATNLAIGLNRALIAGGANEQMRTTARYEIDRLLATGQLNTSRQWRALLQGLGVSARYLREVMGYEGMSANEFANALFSKQISGDEFLRGIEALADSESLNQAIEIYRGTIESGLSNIGFALTRGKANILAALDETLDETTARGISGWLYEIRDGINEVYKGIATWVSENPEKIRAAVDGILEVFQRMQEFDWYGLASRLTTAFGNYIDLMLKLYDAVPEGMFEELIIFATVWAKPIGNALYALGGAVKALGAAFEFAGSKWGWIREFAALNAGNGILGGAALYGGAIAGFGLMMAGYAKEAENAEYVLRDYAAAIDEADRLGKFKNRLEAFASSGNVEGLEEELNAVRKYKEEQERILFDLRDQREELQSGGIDFTLDENGQLGESAKKLAELNGKIHENQNEVNIATSYLEQYSGVLKVLKEAADQAAMEKAFPEGPPDVGKEQLQTLTELIGLWSELRETAAQAIQKQVEGFGEIEKAATVKVGDLTENLNSQAEALEHFSENLGKIDRYAAEIGGKQGEVLAKLGGEIAQQGLEGAGYAQGINDAIEKAIESDDWSAVDALINAFNRKLEAEEDAIDMTAFAETFAEKFSESLEVAFENIEGFGAVEKFLFGDGELTDLMDDITGLSQNINLSYDMLQEEVQNHVDEVGPIISNLIGIDEANFEEQKQLMASRAKEMAEAVIAALEEAKAAVGGGEDSEESMVGGFQAMNSEIMLILEESLPMLLTAMQDTSSQSVTAIDQITDAVQRLIEKIQQLIQILERLRQKFSEVAYSAVAAFNQIINSVQQAINKVQELIDKLMELKSFDGMTINVNVNMGGGEGEGGEGEGGGEGGATGGLFTKPGKPPSYYAKGGWVFMKPKGTDTIPAMLTPGEYVMRKKAVDRLGVPFLQRLNHLDIGGAFDNIMSRVYRPNVSSMSAAYNYYSTSNDNRNFNNTQHIYTNNPDFAFRIANRYAHAF